MNSVAMDALKYSGYMGSLYGSNSTGANSGAAGSNSSDPSSAAAIKSMYSSQESSHPTSLSSSGFIGSS